MCGWVFLKFSNTEVNSENGTTLTHNGCVYKIRNTNVPEFDLISLKNSEVQIICPHARYQIGDTIKFKQ